MSRIGYEELNSLSGELLPEKMLLSLALSGADAHGPDDLPAGGDGKDGKVTVAYACQVQQTQASQGLLGALGLGSPASSTTTCVPAAVVRH
ncbi:hypothetical protein [Streptomyces torulosus]|uniref:hypothetical protein n=1 Tax=Streptomyces torulosus TaxID=68276 RepID=UPI0006EB8B4D|nr:hypothetical protein [Streptomyces torulosus]